MIREVGKIKRRLIDYPSGLPQGYPENFVYIGGACLFYLLSIYYLIIFGSVGLFGPLMGTVFALYGIAESLPSNRRQVAYWLRVFGVALASLALVLIVVDLLGGPPLLW